MPRSTRTKRRPRTGRRLLAGFIVLALLSAGAYFGARYLRNTYPIVLPFDDFCEAQVQGGRVVLTTEQAHNASLIVGEALRRGLVPRASSIALATAYQESGIRNLDYGDADSVGLFQQRPSQGWGSVEQLMDPWYASGAFYEALVEIDGWESADLNDIAQQIQISAYPEAYREHVTDARQLASALTGETPGAFGCNVTAPSGDIDAAVTYLEKVFGDRLVVATAGSTLELSGGSTDVWAATQLSIANAASTGLVGAKVGDASWKADSVDWAGTIVASETAQLLFND